MTRPDGATPTSDQDQGPGRTTPPIDGPPGAAPASHDDGAGAGAAPPVGDAGAAPVGISSVLYKLALAGMGALVLAQDELEAAWKRARGERAEAEGPGAPDGSEPRDEGAATPGEGRGDEQADAYPAGVVDSAADGARVRLQIDTVIGRVLRTLSIPTRDEVEEVSKKLDALAARLAARTRREPGRS